MIMINKEIINALGTIQIFLATNMCHKYLENIKEEERKLTLNTLLQIEENIIKEITKL